MIDLSIVIPVFNKYNFTKSCLNDLSKLPSNHEIIVVDNGSTDETRLQLERSTNINYIRNTQNLGFAKACNLGYFYSRGKNVLFLNNDIRVKSNHENWTQPILDKCSDALVGPTMGQLDKNLNFIQEANKVLMGNSYMSGWCLASSKNIWNKLITLRPGEDLLYSDEFIPEYPQLFSEEFGLAYFEDTDLSFRARKLGIKMEVVEIPVVHFGKITSSSINLGALYTSAKQKFVSKWKKKV